MDKGISLYIHIPFCKQKCYYCDFPSFSGKESLMIEYSKALACEISKIKNKISTIFIGGGTPTYLSLNAWKIIFESINKLNKSNDLEFTIEGNPGTFTKEKLIFFKNMGVNRLSIGLQAWQDDILKSLGRIHTCDDFRKSYYMSRQCGFNNINIDLMFGLPNQTLNNWLETLQNVIKINPEHISCYSLIIEEGTLFYKNYKKLKLPNEDCERQMYELSYNLLKENGYNQYEISNFSKTNKECKHNLVYWSLYDYIGCGSSSHSYFKNKRYRNETNILKYINLIKNKDNAIVEEHENTLKDSMEEFMFMGLRKINGISKNEFKTRFSKDIYDVYGQAINKYKNTNMILEKDDKISLSHKGIQFSNIIMSDFLLD